MGVVRWVRLRGAARCGLRLGAWYRVAALTARDVHVVVHGREIGVARSLLEFRSSPPDAWTVVAASGGADAHVVCPSCRSREVLPGTRTATRRCARCNQAFPVAWDEPYPRAAAMARAREPEYSVREILRRDRRMTRRRSVHDRRRGERRVAERRTMPSVAVVVERRAAERRQGVERRSGQDRRSGTERRHRAVAW
jgi:hypothetical protein